LALIQFLKLKAALCLTGFCWLASWASWSGGAGPRCSRRDTEHSCPAQLEDAPTPLSTQTAESLKHDDERKGVKKTAAATHCPVGLDPVLEAQSGALPDWNKQHSGLCSSLRSLPTQQFAAKLSAT
jgi:hypothetical protein